MAMADDRDELLAHIATLYYHQDQSQQQIATQLDLSRSNISRLLKEARERGIVEIFIRHPLRRVPPLEQQLIERFGLREAGVVQSDMSNTSVTIARAAELAARFLDLALEDAHVLGISWGSTIYATVNAFTPRRRHDVEIVQLMGGVGPTEAAIDGPVLAQRLARRLTGRYRYLHAPLIVDTPEIAQALLAQRNVAETLEIARQSDVALVGIGALTPDVSSLLRAGYLSIAEFTVLAQRGVVGDICARHFDIRGDSITPELDARLVSITLDDVAQIPTVIGVACAPTKARALLGALHGGYLDILVTDSAAAEEVLRLAGQNAPLGTASPKAINTG
jgi:DNA-binding transcriptional regulator LsrR (DeoR family)